MKSKYYNIKNAYYLVILLFVLGNIINLNAQSQHGYINYDYSGDIYLGDTKTYYLIDDGNTYEIDWDVTGGVIQGSDNDFSVVVLWNTLGTNNDIFVSFEDSTGSPDDDVMDITVLSVPPPVYLWYPDTDGDTFGDYYAEAVEHTSNTSPPYTGYVMNNNDYCPEDYSLANNGCEDPIEAINSIITKTYDISGTLKTSSKTYYDDLGKRMQSQSLDIKTGRTWASIMVHDTQGRPAFNTLSAPVRESGSFDYESFFVLDENGDFYTSSSLENDPQNPIPIGTGANTLGRYYSILNTDSYYDGNDYQDITSYPFSRTIYSELNPGKALKTIGGNKINGEWKQSYTFSMPAGNELSQSGAFNDPSYTVSDARKIVKTISRDVHGKEVVIFTDSDGKTLAAARVGGTLNPNKTVITIREQGFVDVHIPEGTTGFNINTVSGITTEVYDLITEQVTTTATNSLSAGFYRVSITNLESYDPTTNPVTIDCNNNYYDYSLNEYDEAGRLTASYQPVGNTKAEKPVTTYSYNALGQLTSTTSPDEGTATFKYRKDGQIRFSQNTKQALAGEFSYTDYDDLGRPIESGVAVGDFNSLDPDAATFAASSKKEQQYTDYDDLESSDLSVLSGVTGSYSNPKFLAGNVAKTENDNTTTYYSYDVYGRVEWIVQDIAGLGIKTIDYTYDPITGAVTEVDYQKNVSAERFIHRYTYDAVDNSLVKVETSTNGSTYTTHADYKYYETGALKRVELATLNGTPLQGIDYVYNLNGQLKSINHPSLTATNDPGGDSNDLFGMQIDYHGNDFTRPLTNITSPSYGEDRYNGNIKGVRWNNKELENSEKTYSYYYNKNNWLTNAVYGQYGDTGGDGSTINIFDDMIYDSGTTTLSATNSITLLPGFHAKTGVTFTAEIVSGTPSTFQSGDYNVYDITYDANGNIKTLNRNKHTESSENKMDWLSYSYNPEKPNQLLRVDDAAGDVTGADDIGDQDGENYEYNEIGQLVKNNEEGIEYIYNASGLVTEIKKNTVTLVKFFYNDKGHRVKKESYISGSLDYTEHYIRDAAGTALAIYRDGQVTEHTIYGASRLGVYYRTGSHSVYQLTDHLGNVRAVVERSGSTAVALVNTDYYPFGMPMPNRDNGPNSYRYGYQGEFAEKEPELGSGINSFQLRLYDSRIGRWISPDPYGQYDSPYLAMGNKPNMLVDPDGGCTDDKGNPCVYNNGSATDFEGNSWSMVDGTETLNTPIAMEGVFIGSQQEYYDTYRQPNWDAYNQFQKDLWMEDWSRRTAEMRMGAVNIILASTAIIDAAELAAAGIATRFLTKTAVNSSLKSTLPAIYRKGLRFGTHSAKQAATRGVTFKMAAKTIEKGEKFFDPVHGTITYVLRNQTLKGHTLKVAISVHNPGLITTVIKSSKSYNSLTKHLIKSSF